MISRPAHTPSRDFFPFFLFENLKNTEWAYLQAIKVTSLLLLTNLWIAKKWHFLKFFLKYQDSLRFPDICQICDKCGAARTHRLRDETFCLAEMNKLVFLVVSLSWECCMYLVIVITVGFDERLWLYFLRFGFIILFSSWKLRWLSWLAPFRRRWTGCSFWLVGWARSIPCGCWTSKK